MPTFVNKLISGKIKERLIEVEEMPGLDRSDEPLFSPIFLTFCTNLNCSFVLNCLLLVNFHQLGFIGLVFQILLIILRILLWNIFSWLRRLFLAKERSATSSLPCQHLIRPNFHINCLLVLVFFLLCFSIFWLCICGPFLGLDQRKSKV